MSRVRIIGGEWRSRLIDVTEVKGLRPTPDRVRETLFNWLGQELDGQRCLDLFAGTGALGFEAASRGAAGVTLVEFDAHAHRVLRRNAEKLGAKQVEIVRGDAVKFLQSTSQEYDVIFLDPPYNQGWLERVEPHLARVLSGDGYVYAEAEKPITRLGPLTTIKHGTAGQVYYHLLARDG